MQFSTLVMQTFLQQPHSKISFSPKSQTKPTFQMGFTNLETLSQPSNWKVVKSSSLDAENAPKVDRKNGNKIVWYLRIKDDLFLRWPSQVRGEGIMAFRFNGYNVVPMGENFGLENVRNSRRYMATRNKEMYLVSEIVSIIKFIFWQVPYKGKFS